MVAVIPVLPMLDPAAAIEAVLSENFDGTAAYWPPEVIRCAARPHGGAGGGAAGKGGKTGGDAGGGTGGAGDGPTGGGAVAGGVMTGPPGDMWALGCVMYMILCEAHPFDPTGESTDEETMRRVVAGSVEYTDNARWRALSEGARELVKGLLDPNPETRYSAADVMGHSWIESSK